MAEIVIRLKWINTSDDRVRAVVIGDEVSELGRLREDQQESEARITAISAVEARLAELTANLPKNSEYWDSERSRFKKSPSVLSMAQSADCLHLYYSYFRYGSWHVHISPKVISRFVEESSSGDMIFSLEPKEDERERLAFSATNLALDNLYLLSAVGFSPDTSAIKQILKTIQ